MSVQLKKVGGSLMAVIPAEVARKAGFEKGQHVDITYAAGKIILKPTAKPDWTSFFAMDFGIPADFAIEREDLEDRDIFGSGGQ
jgi:antitoxin component of MazEF toxin-antitoxin module